jgi:hypothetical protein
MGSRGAIYLRPGLFHEHSQLGNATRPTGHDRDAQRGRTEQQHHETDDCWTRTLRIGAEMNVTPTDERRRRYEEVSALGRSAQDRVAAVLGDPWWSTGFVISAAEDDRPGTP